jgi:ribonuclease P protein subunit POP4
VTSITVKNVAKHELIGLEAEVVRSNCKSYVGLAGKILDETKKTLLIFSGGKIKRIPKQNSTFRFRLPSGELVEVEGWRIVGRPEERLKKTSRRW